MAVLADRLDPRGEKLAKTFIFLPMAISMVGGGDDLALDLRVQAGGQPADGLLNAIVGLFDKGPVFWYGSTRCTLNSLFLMIIMIWTQVGYSMVLLSAAIKGVPEDTVEAGRIDGAGERRIFFSIVVPQIWPTVITVFITVLIGVMKVFDIVYVTTNGAFNTDVIGRRFFDEMFTQGNNGLRVGDRRDPDDRDHPGPRSTRSVTSGPRRPADEHHRNTPARGRRSRGQAGLRSCARAKPGQRAGQRDLAGPDLPRHPLPAVDGPGHRAAHQLVPHPGRPAQLRLVDGHRQPVGLHPVDARATTTRC